MLNRGTQEKGADFYDLKDVPHGALSSKYYFSNPESYEILVYNCRGSVCRWQIID